jgi:hypothetical protein
MYANGALCLVAAALVSAAPAGCACSRVAPAPQPQVLFDEFSHRDRGALASHGWILRNVPGWPGVSGATWSEESLLLLPDPERPGNRFLRLTATTDGTAASTRQSQICHQRKYLAGTYAARVRFTDEPLAGPSGDQLVESFYTISPLVAPMDPAFSEIDFEYLPRGGWGQGGPFLVTNTWETASPPPNFKMDNAVTKHLGSQAGWRTLVFQVHEGKVRFFVDGRPVAEHGGRHYPESFMSINFNLWFIQGGQRSGATPRTYHEDIDWVFHRAGALLSPGEVERQVAAFRQQGIAFRDSVPARVPPLPSPCDL